jgi:hypothetical protein
VAARSKAWVCDRSLAKIVGSNPAEGMDVRLFRLLGAVRSLLRADHSSRGVLLIVVCLSVIVKLELLRREKQTARNIVSFCNEFLHWIHKALSSLSICIMLPQTVPDWFASWGNSAEGSTRLMRLRNASEVPENSEILTQWRLILTTRLFFWSV